MNGTIALEGQRRHGKTQMAVVIGLTLKFVTGLPLYTNDPKLIELGLAKRETKATLLGNEPAIHLDDELWRELDSWGFKDTYERNKIKIVNDFWQVQGHTDQTFIYTTQLHSQMTNRIRDTIDYIIHCRKIKKSGTYVFIYDIINGYTRQIVKTIKKTAEQMSFIWPYYDHKGTILPIFS